MALRQNDGADVTEPYTPGNEPGDYQFVEAETPSGTVVALRVHPRVGAIDEAAAGRALQAALAGSDNGALAASVWGAQGGLRIERAAPLVTPAGKTLSFDRLRTVPITS